MGNAAASHPWDLHGALEARGHHVFHKDGTPFFWLGDTEWVLNCQEDANIAKVLDDRKRRGFTTVQFCAVRWWVTANTTDELTWAARDANNEPPFLDDDPTRLNPAYWRRWHDIFDMAAARGLYVVLMAGGVARKEGPWQCKNADECYAYGRNIGAFFRDCKNLLYSASMDFEGTMGLGVEAWNALARGILDGDGGDGCFITYHPYTTSSTWFHREAWLSVNGIQGSRNETPDNDILVYQRVAADAGRQDPVKPVVFLEGSYEDERNCYRQLPPTTPKNVRMQFYYAFFAGAAGFTYGHCLNWQQCKSVDHLNSPGARHMEIAAKFMQAREWWKLTPDQRVIVRGECDGERRKAAVLSEDRTECLIYFPERAEVFVRLDALDGETVAASWFSPETGDMLPAEPFRAAKVQAFTPPGGWEDAVLVLKTVKAAGCKEP